MCVFLKDDYTVIVTEVESTENRQKYLNKQWLRIFQK